MILSLPLVEGVFFPQIIETKKSKFNGEVIVYKLLGHYTVSVGNLTQSGGLVESIWKKTILTIRKSEFKVYSPKRVLILGLGSGTAARVMAKLWPGAELVGVEIDPVMVEMGKKYFQLDEIKTLQIVNADAFAFIEQNRSKYDLILIDMYRGKDIPAKAKTEDFYKRIKSMLSPQGVSLWNFLIIKETKSEVDMLEKQLREVFLTVQRVKTVVNRVFKAK